MSKSIINLQDNYSSNLKEKISIMSGGRSKPRGEVTIFEKKNGILKQLERKDNLIVFDGRAWLAKKAFGVSMENNDDEMYKKEIRFFGLGNGGGEPGNPLQAGVTLGQDTDLYGPVRLRSELQPGDPGSSLYASKYISGESVFGYFKRFSSVTIREDRANPYENESNVIQYPPLIAEARIEISSDDANGESYEDINEAALFVADPTVEDPGTTEGSGGGILGTSNILKVVRDGDYAIYYLDTFDLESQIPGMVVGDRLYVTGSGDNDIDSSNSALIIDLYPGEINIRKAYIIVENTNGVDASYNPTYPVATVVQRTITPYVMFSRVTFSTLRKSVDREIIFLWKIYF